MKNQLIDRLTRYTTIDTQSDPKSTTTPSTEKQWDLLHLLEKELQQLEQDLKSHLVNIKGPNKQS